MAEVLKAGTYLGVKEKSLTVEGLTFTETSYGSGNNFEPHSHENYYLAYVLEGSYLERNKKDSKRCLPDSVVTHKINEVHSNTSFSSRCRILNVEIEEPWFGKNGLNSEEAEQHIEKNAITIKHALQKISKELNTEDVFSGFGAESALMNTVASLLKTGSEPGIPEWIKNIKEILHYEEAENISLEYISKAVNRHPIHISREFPKYFLCTLSEYTRYAKVERALPLLAENNVSLSEISYQCGFTDQSHFIKVFKRVKGVTPKAYRDLILN